MWCEGLDMWIELEVKNAISGEINYGENSYRPYLRWPWSRAFFVTWSLTRNNLGWNSKKVSLSVQNLETLMRLVVRRRTWKTFFKCKTLQVEGKDFVPTLRMKICLPLLTIAWSLPLYGQTFKRAPKSWSEVIHNPSVKEPSFIICGGWGCKHGCI